MFRIVLTLLLVLGSESESKPIVDLALTSLSTCVLYEDELRCFGRLEYGRRGSVDSFQNAHQVSANNYYTCVLDQGGLWCNGNGNPPSSFVKDLDSISLGYNFACGTKADKFGCWGDNVTAPPDLGRATSYVSMAASACAIVDSEIRCWGQTSSLPADLPKGKTDFVRLYSSHFSHSLCGVSSNGELQCWHGGTDPELEIPKDLQSVREASLGRKHACALLTNSVQCWGDNAFGQLNVPELKNPRSLRSGEDHSCVVDDEGLKCWGSNLFGQTDIPQDVVKPKKIFAGQNNSCAIGDLGRPQCWGVISPAISYAIDEPAIDGTTGKYGACFIRESDKTLKCSGNSGTARPPEDLGPVDSVVGGDRHFCAIKDNDITCWGQNQSGATNVPKTLMDPFLISAGEYFSCAVDKLGVMCWGSNRYNETMAPRIVRDPKEIASGWRHSCLIDRSSVKCWGYNYYGQSQPPSDLVAPHGIAVGTAHSCVIDEGTVRCWGNNYHGQTDPPPGIKNPRQLALGSSHSCALDDEGIKCWGSNTNGELELPRDLP